MERNVFDKASNYEAPEISATEVSVENGFAASPETMSLDAPDYLDGVTL